MCQHNNGTITPTVAEIKKQPEVINPEEAHLTSEERSHLRLKEKLEEGKISLDIHPNKAMNWLIEHTISKNPLFKGLLIFNYIQWIILLPGFVALYFLDWMIGLAILILCFLVAYLVIDRFKRKTLIGGVREFVIKDLVSLEALYTVGAVRFRKGQKGKWIRYPRKWQDVL